MQRYGLYSLLIVIATTMREGGLAGVRPSTGSVRTALGPGQTAGAGPERPGQTGDRRRHGTTGLGAACVGGVPHRARGTGGSDRRAAGQGGPAAVLLVRPLMGAGAR